MYWKKSRYANVGTDCGCGDPCSCDCPTIISWQQQSETRNCEMCGTAEYSGFRSLPVRYYRRRSWSGQYAFSSCGFCPRYEQNYSGYREHSAVDCTISGSMSDTFTHLRGGFDLGCAQSAEFPENSQHQTTPIGPTQARLRFRAWTGSAWRNCHDNAPPDCETCSDTGLETLSEEDTEEDAIARATPSAGTSASSLWEMRSTTIWFTKRTASYAFILGNVRANATYRVTPYIRRRTAIRGVGYGAWEDVEVEPEDFYIAPSDPAYDPEARRYELPRVDLPHVQGWEYALMSGSTVEFVDDV